MDEEANISPAAVGGEEQVHIVARADEELWCLRAMVLSNQWGRTGWPVPYFQGIVIDFCLEPGESHAESCELAHLPSCATPSTNFR